MGSERLRDVLDTFAGTLGLAVAKGAALAAPLSGLPRRVLQALRQRILARRGRAARDADTAMRSEPPHLEVDSQASRPAPQPRGAAGPALKLDLGPAARTDERVEHIPWSYAVDRITAAAIDPDRLYVYWEVTDEAVARARAALGAGGPGAWLSLRVYDTTGLIFDGTNAHGYFDHRVDRSDRQWFFTIGKPSSTASVDVGMKSTEGFFVKMARSGRVDFPPKEMAPWNAPEWMTVVAETGALVREAPGAPGHGRAGSVQPPPPADVGREPPPHFSPIPLWLLHQTATGHENRIREILQQGGDRVEWREVLGEGWFELEGRVVWEGPPIVTTWEEGPFSYPVKVEPPVRQQWQGRSFAYTLGDVTRVVDGPWQVVIRNLSAHREHAVLGRWRIYRSWVTDGGLAETMRAVSSGGSPARRAGASELVAPGASERHWLAASELRLGGASEVWRLGASELLMRGASERLYAGASQLILAGASERRLMGASETRARGSSERWLGGASERAGASERRLGASEQRLGGSEHRLERGPASLPAAGAGAYPSFPPGAAPGTEG